MINLFVLPLHSDTIGTDLRWTNQTRRGYHQGEMLCVLQDGRRLRVKKTVLIPDFV